MCGLFGYSGAIATPSSFFKLMSHRGPDAQDCKDFHTWTLGHLRLSIIDIDSSANQPFSADGAHLVFNGEIYNYLELKDKFIPSRELRTHSDTEVLILLLNEYGISILNHLNGMFAFAYLDQNGQLFVARDRFGIKPLYYCYYYQEIIFSSEIKPLLAYVDKFSLDRKVIESFIHDTATDYDERSGYNQIYSLKKGHFASLTPGQEVIQSQWYKLPKRSVSSTTLSRLREKCEEILLDSIKLRCRADVPLAITLSGGIDSTVIYTLIKEKLAISVQPFVFKHLSVNTDESSLAIRLAHDYGDNPIVVSQDKYSIQDLIQSMRFLEFPIWNASSVAYHSIYRAIASRGFKVVLEGHGSDEQLGGYPYMILAAATYSLGKSDVVSYTKYLRAYLDTCHDGLGQSPKIHTLLRLVLSHIVKAFITRSQSLNEVLDDSFNYRILPIVLRTFDRLSMANSLESRMPFMDYRFVEFCRNLPNEARISGIGNKAILRCILKKYGKAYIYKNKQKMGFSSDLPALLNQSDVREYLSRAIELFEPRGAMDTDLKEKAKSCMRSPLGWVNSVSYWKTASLSIFSNPSFLLDED